jgi:hypothetical protein
MCVWISSTDLSATFLILRIQRDIITLRSVRVRCMLFLSDFKETWFLLADFRKILNKFHEIPSSEAALSHADRRMDRQA